MVIAAGSYPAGRWFESDRRYHKYGSLVKRSKTSPFHGGNTSSILVGVTNGELAQLGEHLPYKQGVTGSSPVLPTIQCPVEPARVWPGILFLGESYVKFWGYFLTTLIFKPCFIKCSGYFNGM